jgi:hypothetical protein
MCQRPHRTRRWCTKCKAVTSWQIDPAINHSRCLICHSDSRFSRKVKKTTKEMPKMNKQYVQEQINIAVSKLREEYDARLAAIYQCPDCGALALKHSDHVCLSGKLPIAAPAKQKRATLDDHILTALLVEPPMVDDPIEEGSPYTAKGIAAQVVAAGYKGAASSVASILSRLAKNNKVMRRAAIIQYTSGKDDKRIEKEAPGFVFWRSA